MIQIANKAYKFRIYPDEEQKVILAKTFGCARFIYNKMLADKIEHYKKTKEKLNNTPAQYKEEFPWLKEVDSYALCNAQMHLQTAYNNFFIRPEAGFPKFKSKKLHKNTYTTNRNPKTDNIRFDEKRIRLPKVGYVKIKQHRKVPEEYILKSVTVSQTPSGKYYASILYEYEDQVQPKELKRFIGLDYSDKQLYKDSNGNEPVYENFLEKQEKRLAKAQRKLSRMKPDSKNREKQRLIVARIHEKIANQRKDYLHKQSRQIANAYDCVCIESLDMKALSLENGKEVGAKGWNAFITYLTYKLEEQGKKLVKLPKENSRTCKCCGHLNEAKNLSIRAWDCPECGTHHERDVNAAVRIRDEGMKIALAL